MISRRLRTSFGIAHIDAAVNISHYIFSRATISETIVLSI